MRVFFYQFFPHRIVLAINDLDLLGPFGAALGLYGLEGLVLLGVVVS